MVVFAASLCILDGMRRSDGSRNAVLAKMIIFDKGVYRKHPVDHT